MIYALLTVIALFALYIGHDVWGAHKAGLYTSDEMKDDDRRLSDGYKDRLIVNLKNTPEFISKCDGWIRDTFNEQQDEKVHKAVYWLAANMFCYGADFMILKLDKDLNKIFGGKA